VAPAHTRPVLLAFDVGGTSGKAAAFEPDLSMLAEARRPSRQGPAILDAIGEAADQVLADLRPEHRVRVAAAGVAMPGLVDAERGVCVRSVNLDVTDLDVAGPLGERLGVPLRVGHDVQAAGEAVRRSAAAVDDPFVVVIGTGIAAVTFSGGRAVTGVSGQAGEFGHIVVRPDGPPCGCGNRGCLETIAGARAIVDAYERRTGTTVPGAHTVVERVGTDPVAAEVWHEAVSALADGLVTVCALLAPGSIVLGGGLSEAGRALTEPLAALLAERAFVTRVPPIVVAGLGARAGLVGAAHLAQDLLTESGVPA